MRKPDGRQRRRRRDSTTRRPGKEDETGFALVEVIAASLILTIVGVSISNLLIGSLSATLLVKQREVAASLASDMVEDAKALGESALNTDAAGTYTFPTCISPGTGVVPVRTASATAATSNIQNCFQIVVDQFTYTVAPVVASVASGSPEPLTVTVSWTPGNHSYVTYSLVGS